MRPIYFNDSSNRQVVDWIIGITHPMVHRSPSSNRVKVSNFHHGNSTADTSEPLPWKNPFFAYMRTWFCTAGSSFHFFNRPFGFSSDVNATIVSRSADSRSARSISKLMWESLNLYPQTVRTVCEPGFGRRIVRLRLES